MSLPQTFKSLRSAENDLEPEIKEIPIPKPGKNQVLVRMEYVPLNPSDLISMTNGYSYNPPGSPVGMEGSGTIAALGEDLKVPHNIGDKVHVLAVGPDGIDTRGTYGEYVVVSSETCPKIKDGTSLEEAACHFVNPATVYYMAVLAERGDHKAVIHSAGSSTLGRMMIRYFKHKGIKLINIVRRDEYIEELKKEGADYVLNLKAPDFETQLKEIAEKEQATLSFDAIGGSFTGTLLRNQPRGSICYVYGFLAGEDIVNNISIIDLFQGKRVAGLVFSEYMVERYKKGELQKYFEELQSLLPTMFKSNIQKVFKMDELKEAVEYYKENSSKGKVLIKLNN